MKPTGTFYTLAFFAAMGVIGLIWTLNGGAADGSKLVMYGFGGIAILGAVLSKVLGGAWFTDNANGR